MLIATPSKIKPSVTAKLNLAHPLTRGLAGCWLLNEGAGRIAHDASGHHHDGSFSGGSLWSPGYFGHAVEFDGYDDWISMGDCLDLGTDDVTLLAILKYSAAIQPEQTGGVHYAAVAGKGYLGPNEKGYGLFIRDNYVAWQTRNLANNFYIVSDSILNDGQYHTAVGMCDRDNSIGVMLYIDGVRQAMIANPTTLDGLDLSGPQPFAMGSRQDQAGTWLFDFQGSVAAVYVWKRVLAEVEIRQLQYNPFTLFSCGQAVALLTATNGVPRDCAASITGQSTTSGVLRMTRSLASSAHASTSLSAIVQAIRSVSGTSGASAAITGILTQTALVVLVGRVDGLTILQGTLTSSIPQALFGAKLENESFWLREALFNGVSAAAFKLGIALTGGWFWTRRQECTVVYRGATITQMDFSNILCVMDAGIKGFSLPAYLSHVAGWTYYYLVRRFNSCGYQEQTANAAAVVRIAPDGRLDVPSPNAVIALRGEQTTGELRLVWFYCPLNQEAAPQRFNVYWNNGTDLIDYEDPVAAIPYRARRFYCYHSGTLALGRYRFAMKAEGAAHVESGASTEVICQINNLPTETPIVLVAETI